MNLHQKTSTLYLLRGCKMPIRKVKKGYKIQNVAGTSPTKEAAKKRLRAVKAAQAAKKKGKK